MEHARTLPAPPPCSTGSCVVTHSVWQICVLPVLQSTYQLSLHAAHKDLHVQRMHACMHHQMKSCVQ
jgi:hypothetical protein